jgi:hypothetical protein
VASVAVKRWGSEVPALSLAAVPMLGTGLVMGGVALVVERGAPVALDARSVAALLYLAVFGSAVTFTIFYWLLARVKATQVALMSYLIPIVAVAVGALLFDEPLSNLDARLRRSMREEIRALQQRLKLTVAYVTHDQSEALAVSVGPVPALGGQDTAPLDQRPHHQHLVTLRGQGRDAPVTALAEELPRVRHDRVGVARLKEPLAAHGVHPPPGAQVQHREGGGALEELGLDGHGW